jgi:signal transduction histidine kinase
MPHERRCPTVRYVVTRDDVFDRRWCRPSDLRLAVFVAIIQLAGSHFATRGHPNATPLDTGGYLLLVAGPAALLVRRRWPAQVLLTVFAVTLTYRMLGYPAGPVYLAPAIAYFSAVGAGRRWLARGTLAAAYGAFLWLPPLAGHGSAPSIGFAVGIAAWLLLLATIAEVVRTQRAQGVERRRAREEHSRRRASEERLRIARELHDVLAHNISLINVQAGVALHLLDDDPQQARTALAAIKTASRDTLRELRATLGVLRGVDEQAPRSPAPGLDRLDELLARLGDAGLRVRLTVTGTPRPVPTAVDLAAYRIVQESLTNVHRHAQTDAAHVTVGYHPDELVLDITDAGRGGDAADGNGLSGIRERAAALGGTVAIGPRPEGGFTVCAVLPTPLDTPEPGAGREAAGRPAAGFPSGDSAGARPAGGGA